MGVCKDVKPLDIAAGVTKLSGGCSTSCLGMLPGARLFPAGLAGMNHSFTRLRIKQRGHSWRKALQPVPWPCFVSRYRYSSALFEDPHASILHRLNTFCSYFSPYEKWICFWAQQNCASMSSQTTHMGTEPSLALDWSAEHVPSEVFFCRRQKHSHARGKRDST